MFALKNGILKESASKSLGGTEKITPTSQKRMSCSYTKAPPTIHANFQQKLRRLSTSYGISTPPTTIKVAILAQCFTSRVCTMPYSTKNTYVAVFL